MYIGYLTWLQQLQYTIHDDFDGGYIDLETFDQIWLQDKLFPRYKRGVTPENMAKLFLRYLQFVKSLDRK